MLDACDTGMFWMRVPKTFPFLGSGMSCLCKNKQSVLRVDERESIS